MPRSYVNIEESLAPKDKAMPYWEERKTTEDDPVSKMAELWAEENVRVDGMNYGTVPLDLILHECNEKCVRYTKEGASLGVKHHFIRREFDERDVRIVNATVRWLATNCGTGFLTNFFQDVFNCRVRLDSRREKLELEESNDLIS